MSYFGTVKDNDGKEFSVSISFTEIVKPVETVAEAIPAPVEEAEPGSVEAQEMPSDGENV